MCKEIFVKLFGFIHERFFISLNELAANGTEGITNAEVYWVRLRVEAFSEKHFDLFFTEID